MAVTRGFAAGSGSLTAVALQVTGTTEGCAAELLVNTIDGRIKPRSLCGAQCVEQIELRGRTEFACADAQKPQPCAAVLVQPVLEQAVRHVCDTP